MQLYLQAFLLPLSCCGPENAELYSEVYSTSASMYGGHGCHSSLFMLWYSSFILYVSLFPVFFQLDK
jgi:hypothetical protein